MLQRIILVFNTSSQYYNNNVDCSCYINMAVPGVGWSRETRVSAINGDNFECFK